jgi:acyl-CoA synthetase (AMP-forming)/AMP-acid ligase II
MISQLRLTRNRNLTLATLLDELLEARAGQEVSYEEDFRGLDHRPQPVQRFEDLYREVNALSRFLVEETGLRRGELVAISKTNDVRCFRWFLAVIRAGGIAVPLNPLLSLAELETILAQCRASVLVTDQAVFESTIRARQALPVTHWIQGDSEAATLEGFRRVSPAYLEAPPLPPMRLDPDDPVAIFYTSGTEGFPKGVALSSRALLGSRVMAILIALLLGKSDLALLALPWAHILAVSTVLYGLIAGARACFLPRFEVQQAIAAIERYRVTAFVGVPAMLVKLVEAAPPREKLASLRVWVSASDFLPPACRHRLLQYGAVARVFGRRVVRPLLINVYGMAELGGSAMLGLDVPGLPGRGELCVPVPPYRVRIADQDGRPMGRGQVGECLIKGPGLPSGYWNDPQGSSTLLTPDGWLRTGDLAVKNHLGLVRLVGRAKEVIKCGGYSVHAREVEHVIATHPSVASAAVVGVPHPQKGEAPIGVVELCEGFAPSEEELLAWCRCRLASYKLPRRIHILGKGALPQGATEKILKRVLRERYARDFGSTESTFRADIP